jgi:hypothetical protein
MCIENILEMSCDMNKKNSDLNSKFKIFFLLAHFADHSHVNEESLIIKIFKLIMIYYLKFMWGVQ